MRKPHYIFLVLFSFASNSFANDTAGSFKVEKVLDNGYYIINGVAWKPHSSCKSLREGDRVKFLEGSPNGDCVSATISDLNSHSTCLLWCKEEPVNE